MQIYYLCDDLEKGCGLVRLGVKGLWKGVWLTRGGCGKRGVTKIWRILVQTNYVIKTIFCINLEKGCGLVGVSKGRWKGVWLTRNGCGKGW